MAALNLQMHGISKHTKVYVSRVSPRRPLLSSHGTMKITMSQHNQPPTYCESIRADIEAHLKHAIPIKPPLSVFEPMHHLTFSVPPNTSPTLCVAACELVGGNRNQAMAAAAALHLMHAATFTHENLPLSDRPKRGPNSLYKIDPEVNHFFKPNIELLIPDAMVPFAFEILAMSDDPTHDASDQILRVMVEITRVVGSQGIINGQYQEILIDQLNDGDGQSITDWIDTMCRKKEGAFHACAAACGAILGGAKEEEVEKLRNYGLYVGMIKGYSNRVGKKGKELDRVVELRNLALTELEHFKGKKVEAISSFVIG